MPRLKYALRRSSTGRPASTLMSSMVTRPVAAVVVVAMAGMMRPAVTRTWRRGV